MDQDKKGYEDLPPEVKLEPIALYRDEGFTGQEATEITIKRYNLEGKFKWTTKRYAKQYKLGKNLIIIKSGDEIIEKFYDNRIKIDEDNLENFTTLQCVNEALRNYTKIVGITNGKDKKISD